MAQFVHHLRRQFDRIAALLVDADTGMAAQEPFDRQFVARQRALRHFVRPRDLHVLAAAGGYVTGRAAHIIQADHTLCGEILISEFRCADEAGLFLHGEDALQRRMRQCIIVEKCHHISNADTVVCAKGRPFRMQKSIFHIQLERIFLEVMFVTRLFLANHVDMRLQHDRRMILIARRSRLVDDDVPVGVLLVLQAVRFRETHQMITQRLFMIGTMRDRTDFLKTIEINLTLFVYHYNFNMKTREKRLRADKNQ